MCFLIKLKIIFCLLPLSFCAVTDGLRRRLAADYLLTNLNTSVVVSPLGLRLPLCKLALYAEGSVRNELLSVLGYQKEDQIKPSYDNLEEPFTALKKIDFIMFNRIFVNYTNEFNNTFMSTEFGVQVNKVGFKYPDTAISFINKMIDSTTYKRVTDVVDKSGDIHKDTSILLVNAAYLKVTWEIPFNLRQTKYSKFHHYNGKISSVLMMSKTDTVLYVDDDLNKIKVINMKLASAGISMTIVIPVDNGSLEDFLNNLQKPNFLRTVKKRMRFELVAIQMPRFKIKTSVDWTDYLMKIGLKNIFNKNNTELNRILNENIQNRRMHLSKAKQKNFIQVDEMGAFRQEPREMLRTKEMELALEATADRPFFFTISLHQDRSDYLNVEDLLTGIFYGPE